MKKWITVSVIAIALATSAVVFAAPGRGDGNREGDGGPCVVGERGGPGGPGGKGLMRLLDDPDVVSEAGLTEEQVVQLKQESVASQKRLARLKADAEVAQIELRALIDSATAEDAAILAAVEAAGQARTAIHKERVQQMLNLRDTIGAEKLKQLRSQLRERFKDRRDKRWDRRGSRSKGNREKGDRPRGRGQGDGAPQWMQSEMPPPDEM